MTSSHRRSASALRLGINVDHVATLRQARGTVYPDPVEAALVAASAGGDSITVHLREDRRHIQDHDVERLQACSPVPVNLELAVTDAMLDFACRVKPRYACLVPERREEVTTEGGLDVAGQVEAVSRACRRLAKAGIITALFIDADPRQLAAAKKTGAPQLEIHTGRYADTRGKVQAAELQRIAKFARAARKAGFEVHAGHGLHLQNVAAIARIDEIEELNIGHSIVARSVFVGFPAAVAEMKRAMREARNA
ncbi:MAG TPA: pyridoxine 5'-phosphate synthase [Solimonas sp.]|nr:pyridoxine 5'-phosphate synthase [Solimonas sp.]